ncbi:MAG: PEP-CTERM sorting domain-containing protein [Verrucomicrobiaceae bacterium]
MKSLSLFLPLLLGSSLVEGQVLWAVDETNLNALYGFTDFYGPGAAPNYTNYGSLLYNNGVAWVDFDGKDIESFAISNANIAYMVVNGKITITGNEHRRALMSLDLNQTLSSGSVQTNFIANLGGSDDAFEALTFSNDDGFLYMGYSPIADANSSDTTPDQLWRVSPTTGATTIMGDLTGLGQSVGYLDGMDFAGSKLYAFDNNDDHLYEINPATGAIIAVSDNNVLGGLDASADIETLAWDPNTGKLLAIDNGKQWIVEITTGTNGGNMNLTRFRDDLGSLVDFEGSGILGAVPEPSNIACLAIGLFGLSLRRKR